eukprot:CAMPEP_0118945446 /NCGR_PEP_ID=MMETSP1169-20130426/42270_1 /TAXON_ID=36882 /ORGANISM="Pyramimonas obovata, Strain CCMP722" /LENGTH=251 /DNA_ID=CAMNT_0006891161 /DNA_START=21 /DNA_END=772 /DNA_ORIENTATION=+
MSVVRLATAEGPMCVPPLGVGCWSWGDDKGVWGWESYDKNLTHASISGAFRTSLQGGVRLFDTAETYGSGLSEEIVATQLKSAGIGDVMIATKFQPGKWANHKVRPAMLQAAKESCERLGVNQIDLYQIHAPLHPDSFTDQGHALADVVEAGLARAVGVSNFNLEQITEVHAALAERGIPLATNQVEYSLLRQYPDTSGLKAGCEKLGVKLLAYSPLGMGRLTGKYSAKCEPQGRRGFAKVPMKEVEPLLA